MDHNLKNVIIYLSGPIDKANGKINKAMGDLAEELSSRGATVMTPEIRPKDTTDARQVFVRDMSQCILADIIIVDARKSCGLGVGAEIAMGKNTQSKIYFICPRNSHYRREKVNIVGENIDDWVHPFVDGFSDFDLIGSENISEIANEIQAYTTIYRKGSSYADEILEEYKATCLDDDEIMKRLMNQNSFLEAKIHA